MRLVSILNSINAFELAFIECCAIEQLSFLISFALFSTAPSFLVRLFQAIWALLRAAPSLSSLSLLNPRPTCVFPRGAVPSSPSGEQTLPRSVRSRGAPEMAPSGVSNPHPNGLHPLGRRAERKYSRVFCESLMSMAVHLHRETGNTHKHCNLLCYLLLRTRTLPRHTTRRREIS